MLDFGIIKQSNTGIFHYLPLGVRILEKLTKIIDEEMSKIDAQKVILPTLINAKLWEKTGRLDDASAELFKVADRHRNDYILSPVGNYFFFVVFATLNISIYILQTHEESVSDLLASVSPISYKQFPIRLYQITSKFRDEIKPRFGLMRARQFLMKDLYTFDVDDKSAMKTYEDVGNCYENIFKTIGIDTIKGT